MKNYIVIGNNIITQKQRFFKYKLLLLVDFNMMFYEWMKNGDFTGLAVHFDTFIVLPPTPAVFIRFLVFCGLSSGVVDLGIFKGRHHLVQKLDQGIVRQALFSADSLVQGFQIRQDL